MENLSTGQNNLGQNQEGSSWQPGSYNSGMPPLPQPPPEDREEIEEDEEEEEEGEDDEEGREEESVIGLMAKIRRENQKKSESENPDEKNSEEEKEDDEKKLGAIDALKKGINEAEDAARKATGKALAESWISLWTFTSYGLTIFYINFHYVMAYLGGPFSRYFPKAGEWLVDLVPGVKDALPGQLKKSVEKRVQATMEPFEIGLTVLINVVIVVAVFGILFMGYILVTESPASLMYKAVVGAVKNSVE